jgi:restriction system protein
MTRYWGIRLGEGGKYVDFGRRSSFIFIGWSVENLDWLIKETDDKKALDKLSDNYIRVYPDHSKIKVSINIGQILRFARDIKKDDIVIIPDPFSRKIIIGRVKSDYQYKKDWNDECDYNHRKQVEWIKEVDRDNLSQKFKNSIGALLTVFNLDNYKEEINQLIQSTKAIGKLEEKVVSGDDLYNIIIDRLLDLSPKDFQDFITHLLGIIGFETETTQFVGDKGVDVTGTLNPEGLVQVMLRVQVKRVTSNIGIEEVQRMRGVLGQDEHGAIITTSSFTKQAQEEAQDEKKKFVSLIDGENLVDIILNNYDKLDEKYKNLLLLKKKDLPLSEMFSTMLKLVK